MTNPEASAYDCVACGRCCFHRPNHVPLYPEDLVKLGASRVAALTALSTEPPAANETAETRFMRTVDGHCVCLDVSPGRFFCNIYEHRPLRCEVYEPGSPSCLAARARPTQRAF